MNSFLGTVSCGAQDEFLLGRLIFLLIPAGLGTVSYGAQAGWNRNFLGLKNIFRYTAPKKELVLGGNPEFFKDAHENRKCITKRILHCLICLKLFLVLVFQL